MSTTLASTFSTSASAAPTSTCPAGNSLPELKTLPIPQNVSVAVIPGSNASDFVMVTCCSPNPVHIADGCYEWCEAPSTHPDIESFGGCLVANHRDLNKSDILGFSNDAPGRGSPSMTFTQLGVWVLFVSGISSLVFSA